MSSISSSIAGLNITPDNLEAVFRAWEARLNMNSVVADSTPTRRFDCWMLHILQSFPSTLRLWGDDTASIAFLSIRNDPNKLDSLRQILINAAPVATKEAFGKNT